MRCEPIDLLCNTLHISSVGFTIHENVLFLLNETVIRRGIKTRPQTTLLQHQQQLSLTKVFELLHSRTTTIVNPGEFQRKKNPKQNPILSERKLGHSVV